MLYNFFNHNASRADKYSSSLDYIRIFHYIWLWSHVVAFNAKPRIAMFQYFTMFPQNSIEQSVK